MAHIHSISIKHFRGISTLDFQFGDSKVVCLIGRGDSGKSTILEAISYALYPNWRLFLDDSDFHNCDVTKPIEIEVTLIDVPVELLTEKTFGLKKRFIDSGGQVTDEITAANELLEAITVKLTVESDLEPKWQVINSTSDSQAISANQRSKLNTFLISDYVDNHFSWLRGNPLYSLLRQESDGNSNDDHKITDALRSAKKSVDANSFEQFDNATKLVVEKAKHLGLDITSTSTTIDYKDIFKADGKFTLHTDATIPFRLKGKGSKRLASIAIQLSLLDKGGLILIDEIEQGLEPDRVQHLVRSLLQENVGQVFMTTHSRDVIVELGAPYLYRVCKNANTLFQFPENMNGCLRSNPESFFANKVLVCEGATEIGICRAIEKYKRNKDHDNSAFVGLRYANGTGKTLIAYASGFNHSGYQTCLFCDSDDSTMDTDKIKLIKEGVQIIDWPDSFCLEEAIFNNIQFEQLVELIKLAVQIRTDENQEPDLLYEHHKTSILDSINSGLGNKLKDFPLNSDDSAELRTAVSRAAISKKNPWFKNLRSGYKLGELILKSLQDLDIYNPIRLNFNKLSRYIDGNEL